MVGMNSSLSRPMNEYVLIDLIKNNVKESLEALLFTHELLNLDHLRDTARRAEKYLIRQQQVRLQKKFVSEVNASYIEEECVGSDYEVAAIKHQGFQN